MMGVFKLQNSNNVRFLNYHQKNSGFDRLNNVLVVYEVQRMKYIGIHDKQCAKNQFE